MAPGSIELVQGELDGATKNRSLAAYHNNDDQNYSRNTAPIKPGNSSYLCIIMFKLIQFRACIGLNSCKLIENIVEL